MKGDDWGKIGIFLILRNRNHTKRCLTIHVQTVSELSNFVPVFTAAEKANDAARWDPMMLSGDAARGKEVKRERKAFEIIR